MGPSPPRRRRRRCSSYLDTARAEEPTVSRYGGAADAGLGGLFVQPTVLTGITPSSTVFARRFLARTRRADVHVPKRRRSSSRTTPSTASPAPSGQGRAPARIRVAARIRAGSVWINAYRGGLAKCSFRRLRTTGGRHSTRKRPAQPIAEYPGRKAIAGVEN